jgi:hypothetical protein
MTKLLTRVRRKFRGIGKISLSNSEKIIRRRIFIEELRSDLYYKYYLFNQAESVILRIMVISVFVFNITNIFTNTYANLLIPSVILIFIIGLKLHIIGNSKNIRLVREVHKIKKVLDRIDLDQELPMNLVNWYYTSKDFIKKVTS